MIRPLLVAGILASGVLAVGVTSVLADSAAIGERKTILKGFGAATRDPGRMLRGEAPFELEKVQAALKTISEGAAKLPTLFPDDSKEGDTKALPIIWTEKDKFVAIYAKLGSDATAAMTSIKDEASFKTEMPKVLGNCGTCHQTYRAK